jgi:hypothetical protein
MAFPLHFREATELSVLEISMETESGVQLQLIGFIATLLSKVYLEQ